MLYRNYRDKVVLPNMNFTNTQLNSANTQLNSANTQLNSANTQLNSANTQYIELSRLNTQFLNNLIRFCFSD